MHWQIVSSHSMLVRFCSSVHDLYQDRVLFFDVYRNHSTT